MKIAIVCAAGIGDALLMQIAANHLQKGGHETVTFSNHLPALKPWFPGFSFERQPILEETFARFDAIVLQHDNTPKAKQIHSLPKPVYTLYGAHLLSKHGPLRPGFDAVFNPSLTMAENISRALGELFPGVVPSRENGLSAPKELLFRKFPKRIAIHPTSTSLDKNWPKASFLSLQKRLLEEGWEPIFITAPQEAPEWGAPLLPTLSDLAALLYESGGAIGNDSGPCHLASNLGLPTVVIGPNLKHLSFWRPGWRAGEIAYPARWVGKLAGKKWMNFISVNHVFKLFMKLYTIK